jgi:hypothetical protein
MLCHRYIHYQTNEAMSSNSAEAEDLDLYVASIRAALALDVEQQEEGGSSAKYSLGPEHDPHSVNDRIG